MRRQPCGLRGLSWLAGLRSRLAQPRGLGYLLRRVSGQISRYLGLPRLWVQFRSFPRGRGLPHVWWWGGRLPVGYPRDTLLHEHAWWQVQQCFVCHVFRDWEIPWLQGACPISIHSMGLG